MRPVERIVAKYIAQLPEDAGKVLDMAHYMDTDSVIILCENGTFKIVGEVLTKVEQQP